MTLAPTTQIDQWKYTACRYNVEKANGFYTFSHSQGVSKEEKDELCEKIAHYVQPDDLPLRPTEAELRKFPVAFSYFTLSSGRKVLCRTCAVGRDYGGSRYGNFFSHALILEKSPVGSSPEDRVNPIRYWDSDAFARGLTAEEINLGRTPDLLPTLTGDRIPIFARFEKSTKISTLEAKGGENFGLRLRALVDAFLKALVSGKNLVVFTKELRRAAVWLKVLYDVLPTEIENSIAFTTYSYDPLKEERFYEKDVRGKLPFVLEEPKKFDSDRVFIYFAPPKEKIDDYERGNFVALNFDETDALKANAPVFETYARVLSDDFLAFVESLDLSAINGVSLAEVDRVNQYYALNYAANIYAATLDSANADFSKRETFWNNAFEFLKTRSLKIQTETFNRLLKNDYRQNRQKALTEAAAVLSNDPIAALSKQDDPTELLARAVEFSSNHPEIYLALRNSVVDCWVRHAPKDDEKTFIIWKHRLRNEIKRIFEKQNRNNKGVENDFFNDLLNAKISGSAYYWGPLAFGFYLAVYKPHLLNETDCEELNRRFETLPLLLKNELLDDYYEEFKRNIHTKHSNPKAASYVAIFKILGLNAEKNKPLLQKFLKEITRNSVPYWKKGAAFKKSDGGSVLEINDDVQFESSRQENALIFVSDDDLLAAKGGVIKNVSTSSRRRSQKSVEPGAETLVGYLLEEQNVEALREIFGTSNIGELDRAERFFNKSNWRFCSKCFKELHNGAKRGWKFWFYVILWITLGTALMCAGADFLTQTIIAHANAHNTSTHSQHR